MNDETTHLVTLLKEAFPDFDALPDDCWISEAIEANQWDFGPEIEIVSRNGGRRDVLRRLAAEHPIGRNHHDEHDERVLDVFTEVEAFAWAREVARIGVPGFVMREGSPDLKVGNWWIEAKAINRSAESKAIARLERPILKRQGFVIHRAAPVQEPSPGLLRKFESQFNDSLKKWGRQGQSGSLITYMHLVQIDTYIAREQTRDLIRHWAARTERESGTNIVVCENWRWQTPLYSQLN